MTTNQYTAQSEPTLEFLNATDDTIECGDLVLTVWGWVGKVYRISKGRYSLAVQYRMPRGFFTPRNTPRHYVHDFEIVRVLQS